MNFEVSMTNEQILTERENRRVIREGYSGGLPFGKWNQPWNNSGGAWSIGSCMKLIGELNPSCFEEWYRGYMAAYGDKLLHSTVQFHQFCATNENPKLHRLTVAEAMDHAVIHAIDETWEGWCREEALFGLLREALRGQGVYVRHASERTDMRFKIDLEVVACDGTVVAGVQVKTNKFFRKAHTGAASWRSAMAIKHADYRAETGANTFFLSFEDEAAQVAVLRRECGRAGNGDVYYTAFNDLTEVLR